MRAETLLVEAWLKAGNTHSDDFGCPGAATVESLVAGCLPEQEARRLTLHLTCCSGCRREVARVISGRAFPGPSPVVLIDLMSRGEVTQVWRSWFSKLVGFLPSDDDAEGGAMVAGYTENSLARIDDMGRLIVDLEPNRPLPPGIRVHISLTSEGARLELCDVEVRAGRLRAVVDLSAFHPRPGTLQPGVLGAEEVHSAEEPALVLPILAGLQDEAARGTVFWDRFVPVAALGDRLAARLTDEIATERDQITLAPRLRATATRPAGAPAGKTAIGRVQYALSALEEYASLWKESNGRDLDGAAHCATQLRAVLSSVREFDVTRPGVPEAGKSAMEQTDQTIVVPRARGELP